MREYPQSSSNHGPQTSVLQMGSFRSHISNSRHCVLIPSVLPVRFKNMKRTGDIRLIADVDSANRNSQKRTFPTLPWAVWLVHQWKRTGGIHRLCMLHAQKRHDTRSRCIDPLSLAAFGLSAFHPIHIPRRICCRRMRL